MTVPHCRHVGWSDDSTEDERRHYDNTEVMMIDDTKTALKMIQATMSRDDTGPHCSRGKADWWHSRKWRYWTSLNKGCQWQYTALSNCFIQMLTMLTYIMK